jgi:GNAT superfamily N-acetyltransferase
VIRLALVDDLPRLREIERAAGAIFRSLNMSAVADDEPPSLETLRDYAQDGRAWVPTDASNYPVAYALVKIVDGAGHVEQVSVHPSHAGQGLGRALIEVAEAWAAQHDLPALTLTTFADVPWNAPYYARLGFHVVAPDQIGDGLRRVREHEAELGLDRWPRVTMCRPVNRPPQLS